MVQYPSVEKITEMNALALSIIYAKKADEAKVLSRAKITEVIGDCEGFNGDIYDKAVVLLKGIVQKHPFASGNRRTAFLAMKYFLLANKARLGIEDNPANARILQGVRENYYSDAELKEWVKNGKIRQFSR
ncbi:MAG: Fic family protein [Candidatus Diapherotrites archaeon]